MSQNQPFSIKFADQLDKHLRVINQAAHDQSLESLEVAIKEVGTSGKQLVEIWRLLWPAIENDETWLQVVRDRVSRREPWSAELFPRMVIDIMLANPTILLSINSLLSLETPKDENKIRQE